MSPQVAREKFDGGVCTDCGNRFRSEFDHVQPRVALGSSRHGNLKPRSWSCHQAKTKRDEPAKLKPGPDAVRSRTPTN